MVDCGEIDDIEEKTPDDVSVNVSLLRDNWDNGDKSLLGDKSLVEVFNSVADNGSKFCEWIEDDVNNFLPRQSLISESAFKLNSGKRLRWDNLVFDGGLKVNKSSEKFWEKSIKLWFCSRFWFSKTRPYMNKKSNINWQQINLS